MRQLVIALALASVATNLGGCAVSPENDPHNLPYSVMPGGSSTAVMQYSTNPYPALNAPPLYGPPAGGKD
jgi:hypothetical protein